MLELNTCDKCANYTPDPIKNNDGSCSLMGDINQKSNPIDGCSGWDCEGYGAGVYVGPKFGCIHWITTSITTPINLTMSSFCGTM